MSVHAIADFCSADKTLFEQVFKDTLDVAVLIEARRAISYKRNLPKDERDRRKDLLTVKINEIESSLSNENIKQHQVVENAGLTEEVINSTKDIKKPKLPDDAPIAVILFAGGGGIEAGMLEAGIRPVISVELDPEKPELSDRIIEVHEANFSEYGTKVIRKTVQQVAAEEFKGFPRNPDYLHSSNVCKNFSNAKGVRKDDREQPGDIEAAIATASAIKILQPINFTLEQVPGFKDSKSFDIIYDCLESEGYLIQMGTVNFADYGVPQSRHRLVLRAGKKGKVVPMPPITERVSWYEAVRDLIPEMEISELLPSQVAALKEVENKNQHILIDRVGAREECKPRTENQTCLTIKRSIFTDGKDSNRNKYLDVVLPDGSSKNLSVRAAARLQSFPDWYDLPTEAAIAGTIIGNAVPPLFAKSLFSQIPVAPAGLPQESTAIFGERKLPYKLPLLNENEQNMEAKNNDDEVEEKSELKEIVKIEDGKTYLLIDAIALDPETQSRVEINQQTIEEYKRDRLNGATFPPITAFFDGKTYHLGDGWHRTLAEKEVGNLRVHANIREGSKRDAKLYSCAANSNHGLRRTVADKRKAVLTLLKDSEWTQWSNREIARRCGVDESMVRKYRTELIDSGAVKPQEEIKFERNGTVQSQRNKPKEIFPRPVVISADCPVEEIRGQQVLATCRPNNESLIVDVLGGDRVTVPVKFVAEVPVLQPQPLAPTSVSGENKIAARSLGLKDGETVLPEVERNEGIEVNFEAIAKLQAALNCLIENQQFLTQPQITSLLGIIKFGHLSKQQQQHIQKQFEIGAEEIIQVAA